MAQVKVWNDNVHPFKQDFKGESIEIPARGHITMEYEEAIDFKGAFSTMPPVDYAGDHSIFYKMIRVEAPPPNSIYKDDGLTNHVSGKRADSVDQLVSQLAQLRMLHPDRFVEDETGGAHPGEIAQLKAENAALKAEFAELREMIQGVEPKRGPGRPKKEA